MPTSFRTLGDLYYVAPPDPYHNATTWTSSGKVDRSNGRSFKINGDISLSPIVDAPPRFLLLPSILCPSKFAPDSLLSHYRAPPLHWIVQTALRGRPYYNAIAFVPHRFVPHRIVHFCDYQLLHRDNPDSSSLPTSTY